MLIKIMSRTKINLFYSHVYNYVKYEEFLWRSLASLKIKLFSQFCFIINLNT